MQILYAQGQSLSSLIKIKGFANFSKNHNKEILFKIMTEYSIFYEYYSVVLYINLALKNAKSDH